MAQSTPTTNFGFQDFFSTTLSSGITASDTTIPLAAAPTPTEGILVIEPDSSTNREIIMYTSVSGSNVVCGSTDDRGISGTTARAHSAGVVVKMNTAADMFEALQSGNALADGAITPRKLVSGSGTSWVWQTWTPTWTNVTVGNGTVVAKYTQIGKTVRFRLRFTLGSTSSISGTVIFSLPVTAASEYTSAQGYQFGVAKFLDTGTAEYHAFLLFQTTTTAGMYALNSSATYATASTVNATVPFTFADTDAMLMTGTYEAA